MSSGEEWRPVPDAPEYEASSLGQVRVLERTFTNRLGVVRTWPAVTLKAWTRGSRQWVSIRRTSRQLSHVVLFAFGYPRPSGYGALHRDDDPTNNAIVNLYWGTQTDNNLDQVRNGKHPNAVKTKCIRGHDFTPENTYLHRKGRGRGFGRKCRQCERDRRKEKA